MDKNQTIVYTLDRNNKKQIMMSSKKGEFKKGKLIVMINEGSASASEIVSGAIQDHDRGLIIGRRSFGKGLVQAPIQLGDGAMLRLTIARYYTPSGKCIQKPYGDSIDYDNDIFERLENGELTLTDTLNRELVKKGGIWPDIFSPIDTSEFNNIVSNITFSRSWRNYCFDFYESHPEKPHENLFEFFENFEINKSVFIDYFNKNKLSIDLLENKLLEALRWGFMLEICNYYYNDQSRYILSAMKDSDVKKAIEQLNINKEPHR